MVDLQLEHLVSGGALPAGWLTASGT